MTRSADKQEEQQQEQEQEQEEEEALFKAIAVNEVDAGRRGERGRGGAIGCKLVERNKGQTQLT